MSASSSSLSSIVFEFWGAIICLPATNRAIILRWLDCLNLHTFFSASQRKPIAHLGWVWHQTLKLVKLKYFLNFLEYCCTGWPTIWLLYCPDLASLVRTVRSSRVPSKQGTQTVPRCTGTMCFSKPYSKHVGFVMYIPLLVSHELVFWLFQHL